jgi:hypothetical protein
MGRNAYSSHPIEMPRPNDELALTCQNILCLIVPHRSIVTKLGGLYTSTFVKLTSRLTKIGIKAKDGESENTRTEIRVEHDGALAVVLRGGRDEIWVWAGERGPTDR